MIGGEPFDAPMIQRYLRRKSDSELAATRPEHFQMWPTRKIVPGQIIASLIDNEKASRPAFAQGRGR